MATDEAAERCMSLLAAGVPLTLLWDLVAEEDPRSADYLRAEPADLSWIPAVA